MKSHWVTILSGAALLVGCDRARERAMPTAPPLAGGPRMSALDVSLDPPCVPAFVAGVWTLFADCTTYTTIFIPDGNTLDGNGHTITALDPPGGFQGPVLRNAPGGTVANVINLGLTASLAGTFGCMGGDNRLRGILFDGASGNVRNNAVVTIKRGLSSGCQEGNGIEIRNIDGTGTKMVLIDHNVAATITSNLIQGAGRVDYIAQNGIQFGVGATGQVSDNSITDNFYTGCSHQDAAKTGCIPFVAAGLLLFDIDPSSIRRSSNTFINDQFNVLLVTHQSLDS